MKKFDIITIGAATRDVFLSSHELKIIKDPEFSTGEAECFALGSKLEIDKIVFETGGGAANTSVGFARQGLRSAFIGKIGSHDGRGREILVALKKERVSTALVVRDPDKMTAYSVILLSGRGERTVLVYRGASADFHPGDIRPSKLTAPWIYVSSLAGRLTTLQHIWSNAMKRGIRIAWNPGAGELKLGLKKLRPLLAATDVFMLNQEEAVGLFGLSRPQDRQAFDQLRKLVRGVTVITEGTEGSLGGTNQAAWHCGTHPIQVIDTTGAGDAFGSGFVGHFIRHQDVAKALQFGTANSESVIRHIGAKPGLLKGSGARHPAPVRRLA